MAFSPYENYLLSGRETHVGLIAQLRQDRAKEFASAIRGLLKQRSAEGLGKAGIRTLSA